MRFYDEMLLASLFSYVKIRGNLILPFCVFKSLLQSEILLHFLNFGEMLPLSFCNNSIVICCALKLQYVLEPK
jgi:hypothetical protein